MRPYLFVMKHVVCPDGISQTEEWLQATTDEWKHLYISKNMHNVKQASTGSLASGNADNKTQMNLNIDENN